MLKTTDNFPSARETKTESLCLNLLVRSDDGFLQIFNKTVYITRCTNKFMKLNFVDNCVKNGFFRDIGCDEYQRYIKKLVAEGESDECFNMNYLYDLVRISKFIGLKIKNENNIYLTFKAPLNVGIVNLNQETPYFILMLNKETVKHSYITENSEYDDYGLKAAFPVPENFKIRSRKMVDNDNYDGYEFTDEGIIVHHTSDLNECVYNSLMVGRTILPPQIDILGGNSADSNIKNVSRFYKVASWPEVLNLINVSSLVEIVPGKNRQIYLVFEAKKTIGYQITREAEEDEEYLVKNIDGMLRPVGPVRFTKRDTKLFTIVYTPKKVNDDYKSEKFVWTRAFPGYPDVHYLLDSLHEGDVIYGSEANTRNLSPVAP